MKSELKPTVRFARLCNALAIRVRLRCNPGEGNPMRIWSVLGMKKKYIDTMCAHRGVIPIGEDEGWQERSVVGNRMQTRIAI